MLPPPTSTTTVRPFAKAGVLADERLDAQIGDAVYFGFVERLDLKTGGDIHAIDKRQAVGRFAHGAGGDDADLVGAVDPVFLAGLGDMRVARGRNLRWWTLEIEPRVKQSLPRLTAWLSVSSVRTEPSWLISASAIRTDDVPMSITATGRGGGVGGGGGLSGRRLP